MLVFKSLWSQHSRNFIKAEGDLNPRELSDTFLPEGLVEVGGNLDLSETSITSLPRGLRLGKQSISKTPNKN
jgi:hypothetical protein